MEINLSITLVKSFTIFIGRRTINLYNDEKDTNFIQDPKLN